MIRIVLPQHLRTLANVQREVTVEVHGSVTQRSILDALEAGYPMLRGTIRDRGTQTRRPLVRFFACEEDLSNESPDATLPESVADGTEPFFIVGAIAGGFGKQSGDSRRMPVMTSLPICRRSRRRRCGRAAYSARCRCSCGR